MMHWYYSMYDHEWASLGEMILRKVQAWEQFVLQMELHWGLERGAQPRSSLASLFGVTSLLFGARTVTIKKQKRLLALWAALWDVIVARGPNASTGGPVASTTGPVASTTTHCIQIACRGQVAERPKEQIWSRLPHQVHKSLEGVLKKVGYSFPALILAIVRCASLRPYYQDECFSVARELARDFVGLIELVFLRDAPVLLTKDLPAGALERYRYRCGRTETRRDPRLQAGW